MLKTFQNFPLTFCAVCGTMGTVKENTNRKEWTKMEQYELFFIKQNKRFDVKLYEPEILHCLIDMIEAGYILLYIKR